MMKEFFWQYFHNTGSVDAYLIYKEPLEEEEGSPVSHYEENTSTESTELFN